MAYEIFEKKKSRLSAPAVTVNPRSGRISLNAATSALFHKEAVELVLLMWDSDNHKIAIRPITKVDKRAYKVSYGRNRNSGSFAARSFLEHIKWRRDAPNYTTRAAWNEDLRMLEFVVGVECLKDSAQMELVGSAANKNLTQGQ